MSHTVCSHALRQDFGLPLWSRSSRPAGIATFSAMRLLGRPKCTPPTVYLQIAWSVAGTLPVLDVIEPRASEFEGSFLCKLRPHRPGGFVWPIIGGRKQATPQDQSSYNLRWFVFTREVVNQGHAGETNKELSLPCDESSLCDRFDRRPRTTAVYK